MLRTRTLLVAIACSLAACGGDSGGSIDGTTGPSGPVPATPVGSYALETVDGKPLPAPVGEPVTEDEYTIVARALSGKFTFYADSSFEFEARVEIVATGIDYTNTVTVEFDGTYVFDESTITLTSTDGVTTVMTRAGNTLTSLVTAPAADGGKEAVTMVFGR